MEPLDASGTAATVQRVAPKLDTTTRLAYERTRIAYDRTVMAAVRTATSLITFGFTIYKFFEFEIGGRDHSRDHSNQFIGPREFGITMILIGLALLSLSSFEYWRDRKEMQKHYSDMPGSTAGLLAGMIASLGILALIVAILRG